MADIPYTYKIEDSTIWITFEKPTNEQRENTILHSLNIDSLEDYREKYGYDYEMFDGYGIDWRSEYLGGYMPTFERLDYANGGDWY